MQTLHPHWKAVIVALITGVILTRGWIMVLEDDLLHRWQPLPTPPAAPVTLVTIWELTLYVQASDGRLFAIEPARDTQWTPITAIQSTERPIYSERHFFGPCDRAAAKFRWSAAPPPNIRECIEAETLLSVAYFNLAVIRDTHDQLWYFQTNGSDFFLNGFISVVLFFVAATLAVYAAARALLG